MYSDNFTISDKTCSDDCNGHGTCKDGKCICDTGYIGVSCNRNLNWSFCLHLLYLFELQKLLVRKYAVLMVFAYKTNAFVMLDTVDQIAQFKVKFLSEKGCVNYILFFTFSRTKMPWKL